MLDIIQGKTIVAEASRIHDVLPSEIEKWVGLLKMAGQWSDTLTRSAAVTLPLWQTIAVEKRPGMRIPAIVNSHSTRW